MAKRRRPESGTWYAIRLKKPVVWWGWERGALGNSYGERTKSFARACLVPDRRLARRLATTSAKLAPREFTIVPVRCRVLPSAKRNRTRTR